MFSGVKIPIVCLQHTVFDFHYNQITSAYYFYSKMFIFCYLKLNRFGLFTNAIVQKNTSLKSFIPANVDFRLWIAQRSEVLLNSNSHNFLSLMTG